jgi:hypothetical protein
LNKIIVCNATPIISLIKVKQLDILHQLYGNIIIPKAVYSEITEYAYTKKDYINIEKVNQIIQKLKDLKIESII